MDVQRQIEQKVTAAFDPVHLEVSNESSQHNVPPGARTHFRVAIVSAAFIGKSRVQRHRAVYRELQAELDGPVKALSLLLFDPDEWADREPVLPVSPPCLGGDRQ